MWKTSTIPSALTLSIAVLNAQKAPVLPIPALRWRGREGGKKKKKKKKGREREREREKCEYNIE